jgi:hypothetical protein
MLLVSYYIMVPDDSNERRFGYVCQWQASDHCNLQRGSRNKYKLISHLHYNFILNPLMVALSNPIQRDSWGWGCSSIKTMAMEGKRLHHGGDVCVLVFN